MRKLRLLIAFIFMWTCSLFAQQDKPALPKMAVLPWAMNKPLKMGGGLDMASFVSKWVSETGKYTLVSEKEFLEKVKAHSELDMSCQQAECLKKIVQTLQWDYVITGELTMTQTDFGSIYRLKVISVDIKGEETEFSELTSGTEEEFMRFMEKKVREFLVTPLLPSKAQEESSLEINSRPLGVEIYLDETKAGVTPLTLPSLTQGGHTLKLVLSGYEDWQEKIIVAAGEKKVITAEMIEKLGLLTLITSPADAKVLLNKEIMGNTPLKISVPVGEYELEILEQNYEHYQRKIAVSLNMPLEINVKLIPGLSEEEKAELERLTKLKEEKGGELEEQDEFKLKKLEVRKQRREAAKAALLEEKAELPSEVIEKWNAEFTALLERQKQACSEKNMAFVQTREFSPASFNVKESPDFNKIKWGVCIDRLEVTVKEFKSYLPTFTLSEYSYKDNYPVTRVTFEQAKDFCQQKKKRLCSRDEWTKACLGETGKTYFYGEKYVSGRCRTGLKLADGPLPVGSMKDCTNELGIYDMNGNVWEWTEDKYYPNTKVVRGGSWVEKGTPCEYLGAVEPTLEDDTFGFRCCSDSSLE